MTLPHPFLGARSVARSPHAAARRSRLAASLVAVGLLFAAACGTSPDETLQQARSLHETGQYQESVPVLREFLKEAPDHAEANYLLGVALFNTGQPSVAVWPLRKAREAEEYGVDAGILLTAALLNTRNLDSAIEAVDEVLALDPEHSMALSLRTQAHLQTRDFAAALQDAERLLELVPESTSAMQLQAAALAGLERYEEAREVFAALEARAEEEGNQALAARACAEGAGTGEEDEETLERAAEGLRTCAERYPTDPTVVSTSIAFFSANGEPEEALRIARTAAERAPESFQLRQLLANVRAARGELDEAQEVLAQAAEDFQTAQAWLALADLHRRRDDLDRAQEALGKAAQLAPANEEVRFRQAEILAELGQLEEAEALAEGFEERAFRDVVRGRILEKQGQPEAALEALEAALERWPNNAVARSLAGRIAQDQLQFERALNHYREAVRADAAATQAGLVAAQLAFDMGRYQDAVTYATRHLGHRPERREEAFALALRAAYAGGLSQEVKVLARRMSEGDESAQVAMLQEGVRAARRQSPEKALEILESRGGDLSKPVRRPLLRELLDVLATLDRAGEALEEIDRVLAERPEDALLHDLRGRVLLRLDRPEDARGAFERALELEPELASAHAGLGALAIQRGDLEAALERFEAAGEHDPDDMESAYRAAQVVLQLRGKAEAEARLRALLARSPGHGAAANDLAWILAEEERDLDLALRLARTALEEDDGPHVVDTLAWVLIRRGEHEEAISVLQEGLSRAPDSALLHYRLGLAEKAQGNAEAARSAFQQALEAQPSAPQAEAARAELAALGGPEAR